MSNIPSTLSNHDIREIVRQHPAVFAAIGNAGSEGEGKMAGAIASLILANPAVIDSVVMRGLGVTPERAANMGFLKWISAVAIISNTVENLSATELVSAIAGEMLPLGFSEGALQ